MNVLAKFDEIPSMTVQDIKETKRHWKDGRTDVKTVNTENDVKIQRL